MASSPRPPLTCGQDESLPPLVDPDQDDSHPPLGQGESIRPLEDPKQYGSLPFPKQEKFKWVLENFSKNEHLLYISSEVFMLGGYWWFIVVTLKDITNEHLGLYLFSDDCKDLYSGKSRTVDFSMAVINQSNPQLTIRKAATNLFHEDKPSWGISTFMPLKELYDPSRGYLVDNTLTVEISVDTETTNPGYYSKNETGYVGLKNQGATCYLNSLIQTLFHIPYFRKAVYQIPTMENELQSKSILLALQSIFYQLQYSKKSVSTKGLTKSFGWDSHESIMQHDVQELNRVLCEKLENKMKGTAAENVVKNLFEGYHMTSITCTNIVFSSERKESFLDLQLDIKGCKDVYDSFDKYVESEILEGDNKYDALEHGFQDARKGVLFIDFPPVLQLHLKRFEYDLFQDTMVKINDRYEFPLQLDLDRDNGRYLSSEADRSVRNVYPLHSVLVHKGGISGGHYYAYIRPTLTDQWYQFNDEVVMEVVRMKALEEQYGGGETQVFPTAYMLVYIREDDKERVMCNVDDNDISPDARDRAREKLEKKERKRKENIETEIYRVIKVATDEDIRNQIGKDIYFHLVDEARVRSYQVQKQSLFRGFKDEIAKEYGIAVQDLRFWICSRLTPEYIPFRILTEPEENKSVGNLDEELDFSYEEYFKLFLEVNKNKDNVILALPETEEDEVLIFFKLYDPYQQKLQYVGRIYVQVFSTLSEIIPKLNEMTNFQAEQKLDLYKETMIDGATCFPIDTNSTVLQSQLYNGDILCFQKCLSSEEMKSLQYPTVKIFMEYIHSKKIVHFRCLQSPNKDEFKLELSRNTTYNEVIEKVSVMLGQIDEKSKITLTGHNYYLKRPFPGPISSNNFGCLAEIFPENKNTVDILYFEVLSKYSLKTLEVAIHSQKTTKVSVQSVSLPENCSIDDVITVIKEKVPLSNRKMRILQISSSMITEIFARTMKIGDIKDSNLTTLRAEEIPEEEEEMDPKDMIIHVNHFIANDHMPQRFGDPFLLAIHETETLADVKARIKRKLEVPDDEFSKWKFYYVNNYPMNQFKDTDIIFHSFMINKSSNLFCLGILHTRPDDDTPLIQPTKRRHSNGKGIIIYD